jgi:hypothetical protein
MCLQGFKNTCENYLKEKKGGRMPIPAATANLTSQPSPASAPKNVFQNFGDGANRVGGDFIDSAKDIFTLKGDLGDVARVIISGVAGVLPISMIAGGVANAFTGGQWVKDRQS